MGEFGIEKSILDKRREERNFDKNPPTSAPGQSSNDDWGDIFSKKSSNTESNEEGSIFKSSDSWGSKFDEDTSSILSNRSSVFGGQQQQNTPPVKTTEDKIIDGVGVVGKGLFNWLKEFCGHLITSLTNNDARDWFKLGMQGVTTSAVVIGFGFFLLIFGRFFSIDNGRVSTILAGGLLGLSLSFVIAGLHIDKARALAKKEVNESETDEVEDIPTLEDIDFTDSEENEEEMEWDEAEDDEIEEDDDEEWEAFEDYDEDEEEVGNYEEDINIDSTLNSLESIPVGTYTRSYLFETFMKVLPLMNPKFTDMVEVDSDEEDFLEFDTMIQQSAIQTGMNEEYLPDLEEMRENMFLIQLKCSRPSGMKEEDIARELAEAYKRDSFGRLDRTKEGSYCTVSSVGANYIINLFKGSGAMISLGDMYNKIKDFILSPNTEMPMVWGVNELGEVIYSDAGKMNHLIISGTPRSGKSWKASSVILQLAMFSSPKEVMFEIFDIKDKTSDFYKLFSLLPHIKGFHSKSSQILKKLKYLTTTEADKRTRFLSSRGFINIRDYNKANPNDKLPYLYIVIDEMVSLKNSFTKDELNEYQGCLGSIVSKMPNLGIRAIFIPHRINNEVINKNVYALINNRISVKGSFDDIKVGLDVTKKSFPYNLPNEGDMALKNEDINKGNVVYVHGDAIASTSEKSMEIFRYVGEVWNKLEPSLEEFNTKERQGSVDGSSSYTPTKFVTEEEVSEINEFVDSLSDDDLFSDSDSEDFWDKVNKS